MTGKNELEQLLQAYITRFPAEQPRMALFASFLAATDGAALTDRKNFNGHITTSAFIVDIAAQEMLLLRHRSLGRWLQPGGHVEPGDATLLLSALREAVEETGIPAARLRYMPLSADAALPPDIESHYIPANPKKAEEGHYHHDIRYLFAYTGERANNYNEEEATGMKWVPYAELHADPTFAGVVSKVRELAG